MSNVKPIDENTLNQLNLNMLLQKLNDANNTEKELAKQKAIALNGKLVQYALASNNTSLLTGNSMFSTYISNSDEQSQKNAIKFNHPLLNSTECEEFLVKQYNLSSIYDLMFVTNKINASLNNDNNDSYKFSVYNAYTGMKMDLDLCNNLTYSVQLPITNMTAFNLTKYNEVKSEGIDSFNPNDPAFTDRCYSHIDNTTGADTTINSRKQNYLQQKQPMCVGINCTYQGISEFDYIQCTCTGMTSDNALVNKAVNNFFTAVSKFNIAVIFCSKVITLVIFNLILVQHFFKLWVLCQLDLLHIVYNCNWDIISLQIRQL
jgi:hypothetical protein